MARMALTMISSATIPGETTKNNSPKKTMIRMYMNIRNDRGISFFGSGFCGRFSDMRSPFDLKSALGRLYYVKLYQARVANSEMVNSNTLAKSPSRISLRLCHDLPIR